MQYATAEWRLPNTRVYHEDCVTKFYYNIYIHIYIYIPIWEHTNAYVFISWIEMADDDRSFFNCNFNYRFKDKYHPVNSQKRKADHLASVKVNYKKLLY